VQGESGRIFDRRSGMDLHSGAGAGVGQGANIGSFVIVELKATGGYGAQAISGRGL
jgi:hypothetical protein